MGCAINNNQANQPQNLFQLKKSEKYQQITYDSVPPSIINPETINVEIKEQEKQKRQNTFKFQHIQGRNMPRRQPIPATDYTQTNAPPMAHRVNPSSHNSSIEYQTFHGSAQSGNNRMQLQTNLQITTQKEKNLSQVIPESPQNCVTEEGEGDNGKRMVKSCSVQHNKVQNKKVAGTN